MNRLNDAVSIAAKDADKPYFCLARGGFTAERGEISHLVFVCLSSEGPAVSIFLNDPLDAYKK